MSRKVIGWLTGLVFPILVAVCSSAAVIDYLLAFVKLRLTPEVNWIGATYQPDGKGGFEVFTDSWVLDDSHGRVNATITKDDSHATWIAEGYSLHQVISIAYKADQEKHSGIGTFYLAQRGNRDDYFGSQVYADCDVGKILSCPYILIPKGGKALIQDTEHQNYLHSGCIELKGIPVYASCTQLPVSAQASPGIVASSSPVPVSLSLIPTASAASAAASGLVVGSESGK
jgi:hypothetical protein